MREPGSANDVSVVYSKIMAHTSSLIINLQAFSCLLFFLQVPFNGGFQNAKENVDDSAICTANLSHSSLIREV